MEPEVELLLELSQRGSTSSHLEPIPSAALAQGMARNIAAGDRGADREQTTHVRVYSYVLFIHLIYLCFRIVCGLIGDYML
jgi:hypothetical protein